MSDEGSVLTNVELIVWNDEGRMLGHWDRASCLKAFRSRSIEHAGRFPLLMRELDHWYILNDQTISDGSCSVATSEEAK